MHGTEVRYSHGPPRTTELRWPGDGGAQRARLSFTPAPPDQPGGLTLDGPWAWFRLLDRAEIAEGQDGDRLEATFRLGKRYARYAIRTDSVVNPFKLKALRTFECPPEL